MQPGRGGGGEIGNFLQLCVAWRSARPAGGLAARAPAEGWRRRAGRRCTQGGQSCTGGRSLSRPEVLCCQAGAVMELGRARKR